MHRRLVLMHRSMTRLSEAGDEDLKKLHSAEDIEKEGKNPIGKMWNFPKNRKNGDCQ